MIAMIVLSQGGPIGVFAVARIVRKVRIIAERGDILRRFLTQDR
jgi:hypothetical protein